MSSVFKQPVAFLARLRAGRIDSVNRNKNEAHF
jgi:hypothetical protein